MPYALGAQGLENVLPMSQWDRAGAPHTCVTPDTRGPQLMAPCHPRRQHSQTGKQTQDTRKSFTSPVTGASGTGADLSPTLLASLHGLSLLGAGPPFPPLHPMAPGEASSRSLPSPPPCPLQRHPAPTQPSAPGTPPPLPDRRAEAAPRAPLHSRLCCHTLSHVLSPVPSVHPPGD